MEEELRCPACRHFLRDPILLQCAHSYCRLCALAAAQTKNSANASPPTPAAATAAAPQILPATAGSASATASDSVSLCCGASSSEADETAEWLADDKFSETDSGVVIYAGSRGSRPSSFLGAAGPPVTPSRAGSVAGGRGAPPHLPPFILSAPSIGSGVSGCILTCAACQKPSFFPDGESGIRLARQNVAVRRLLERLNLNSKTAGCLNSEPEENCDGPSSSLSQSRAQVQDQIQVPNCQWCEGDTPARPARLYCETCGYYYCEACRPVIHPARGPLRAHRLVEADSGRTNDGTLSRLPETKVSSSGPAPADGPEDESWRYCESHADEPLALFCEVCRVPICALCLGAGGGGAADGRRHAGHDVHSLTSAAKAQKTELSQTLQLLSEKAKAASEDIAKLRLHNERINANCAELTAAVDRELDALVSLIQSRRQRLHALIGGERERKRATLRAQTARCQRHLARTTALIQFSIELLKEPDPVAYLQIGSRLADRVTSQEFLWGHEMRIRPEADAHFALNLDVHAARVALQAVEFTQFKVPPAPSFDAGECSAENNSVMLTWNCPPTSAKIDSYSLEIDSGWDDGAFKVVYCGAENSCTIDGLHFNTLYNARVKATNAVGESFYSEPICLQTAPVAWFQLQPAIKTNHYTHQATTSEKLELVFGDNMTSVTGTSVDYRTCVGSVGFSRGLHYWEAHIERYDGNADVVLGVAQPAVDTRQMLGKDVHGWSMYVDAERSWFLHNDQHTDRRTGGLATAAGGVGAVIGVLLDCDKGKLSFFVNDMQTPIRAFRNMPRVLYYPAFSVNRYAAIKIHTGLHPPPLTTVEDIKS